MGSNPGVNSRGQRVRGPARRFRPACPARRFCPARPACRFRPARPVRRFRPTLPCRRLRAGLRAGTESRAPAQHKRRKHVLERLTRSTRSRGAWRSRLKKVIPPAWEPCANIRLHITTPETHTAIGPRHFTITLIVPSGYVRAGTHVAPRGGRLMETWHEECDTHATPRTDGRRRRPPVLNLAPAPAAASSMPCLRRLRILSNARGGPNVVASTSCTFRRCQKAGRSPGR